MTAQVTMLTDEAVQESAHAYGDANETYDGEVQAYIDGARFARDRYEAREKLWREAFNEARDYVLNERGPLDEQNAGSDFINDVLGILDDSFAALGIDKEGA